MKYKLEMYPLDRLSVGEGGYEDEPGVTFNLSGLQGGAVGVLDEGVKE